MSSRIGAAVAVIAVLAACGGIDPGDATTLPPDTEPVESSTTEATTIATASTLPQETTTSTTGGGGFDAIAESSLTPSEIVDVSPVGAADFGAAADLVTDLEASGADLTGIDIWVFDVNGSADRLLVLDVDPTASALAEGTTEDLFALLAGAPSLTEARVTRFVLNYYDSDEQGPFVLTTTIPLETLLESIDSGSDVSDAMEIQIDRSGVAVPLPPPAPTPLPAPGSTILADAFDGSTTLVPLFGESIVSTEVVDGRLEMTVLTGGMIPALYPTPLPETADISFDFDPRPLDPAASFGAVVLSEDPGDSSLEHYVAVLATPSPPSLTVIPWNAAAGGWGVAQTTPIPTEVGFSSFSWHTMRLLIDDGAIEVIINNVSIATWAGDMPATSGFWGPVIAGVVSGDSMLIDDVLVVEVEQP